jgi:hypothetical protein
MEKAVLKMQSIFVGSDEMSDQVLVSGAVVENFDMRGGLDEDLGMARGERGRRTEAEK